MVYVKMVNKIIITFMFISRSKRNRRQLVTPFLGGRGRERGVSIMFYVKMVIVYHLQKKFRKTRLEKNGTRLFGSF